MLWGAQQNNGLLYDVDGGGQVDGDVQVWSF